MDRSIRILLCFLLALYAGSLQAVVSNQPSAATGTGGSGTAVVESLQPLEHALTSSESGDIASYCTDFAVVCHRIEPYIDVDIR